MKKTTLFLLIFAIVGLSSYKTLADCAQIIINIYRGECTNIYGTNNGHGMVTFEVDVQGIDDSIADLSLELYKDDVLENNVCLNPLGNGESGHALFKSEEISLLYAEDYGIKANAEICGASGLSVVEYFDIRPVARIPQNINIVRFNKTNSEIELEWTPVEGATAYELYFDIDAGFKNGIYVAGANASSDLIVDIMGLDSSFKYFYIVACKGSERVGRSGEYLIRHKIITGTVSLPDNKALVDEDMILYISAWTDNGKPNYFTQTQAIIPRGNDLAFFSLSVRVNNPDTNYYVRYYADGENKDYICNGYYSSDGVVSDWNMATSINMGKHDTVNIDLKLLGIEDITDDFGDDVFSSTDVQANFTIHGIINYSGDIDCFSFTPSYNGRYTIISTGDVDLVAYLLDSNGNEIKTDDDGGKGLNFRITHSMTADETYFIKIRHYSAGTGKYKLHIMDSEYPNTISCSLTVRDSNDIPVQELLPFQNLKLEAELFNNHDYSIRGLFLVGLYFPSGYMKVVSSIPIKLEQGESIILKDDLILYINMVGCYIKVFILDGFTKINPLTKLMFL